jgi:hypothetical protein
VFGGAESENAGTDKGILSATPSVNAIAIETRFVNADMLASISPAADIGSHFTNTTKLRFRNWWQSRRPGQVAAWSFCSPRRSGIVVKVGCARTGKAAAPTGGCANLQSGDTFGKAGTC